MSNRLISDNKKNTQLLFLICISLITLSHLVLCTLFEYVDTKSFTVWAVDFWDVLFKGDLQNYYQYAYQNIRKAPHGAPAGSYLTFFPWIIWGLPLYLLHPTPGPETVKSFACIVWMKLMLLLFLAVLCIFLYKTVLLITSNKINAVFAVIFCAGSLELAETTTYAGQDEIVYLAFFMIALYSLLKKRKLSFIIFSILSVTVCPLIILPLAVVLFLHEKNLIKDFLLLLLALVPSLIFELIYGNDSVYLLLKDENTLGSFQVMINSMTIDTPLERVCIPAIALVLIAFWAYTKKSDEELLKKNTVKALALVFTTMCFTFKLSFYRQGIYVPFLILWIFISDKNLQMKTLVWLILSIGKVFESFTNSYIFNKSYASALLSKWVSNTEAQNLLPYGSTAVDSLLAIDKVIIYAAIIILVYLCSNEKKDAEIEIPVKAVSIIYSSLPILLIIYILFVFK